MAKVSGKIFDIQLFSKLLEFVKPYKTTYYFVMIAAILLSVFSTLTPYLLKVTVDDYIRLQDYEGMVLMVSLMLGALLFEVLFQFLFVFVFLCFTFLLFSIFTILHPSFQFLLWSIVLERKFVFGI